MTQDSYASRYTLSSWFATFSLGTWVLLLVSFLLTSLTLCLVVTLSPTERSTLSLIESFRHLTFGSRYNGI